MDDNDKNNSFQKPTQPYVDLDDPMLGDKQTSTGGTYKKANDVAFDDLF